VTIGIVYAINLGSEVIYSFNGILFLVVLFSLIISKYSLISLIAFKSIIIKNYLRELKELYSQSNIFFMYKTILKIKNSVKIFDDMISFAIFLATVIRAFTSLSALCLLAFNFNDCAFYIIPTMIDSFVYLFLLCFVTEILPKNIQKFGNNLEDLLSESQITNPIAIQYLHLIKMNETKIGFTAMGLFRIRLNTIVTIFSVIVTNAIILIQTGGL
jgi:hypothetical protein